MKSHSSLRDVKAYWTARGPWVYRLVWKKAQYVKDRNVPPRIALRVPTYDNKYALYFYYDDVSKLTWLMYREPAEQGNDNPFVEVCRDPLLDLSLLAELGSELA